MKEYLEKLVKQDVFPGCNYAIITENGIEMNSVGNKSLIPKIEKYIEYILTILIKLPRTEKFSIGNEIKTSMYEMLKYTLLASKVEKKKYLNQKNEL